MNFFGLGSWEFVVIILIMLIVAGPKRMMRWAYILGIYLGKLRVFWRQMMESLQAEFDEAGVDVKLPRDLPTKGDVQRLAAQAARPIQEPMEKAMKDYETEIKRVEAEIQTDAKNAENAVKAISDDIERNLEAKTSPSTNGFGAWSNAGDQE